MWENRNSHEFHRHQCTVAGHCSVSFENQRIIDFQMNASIWGTFKSISNQPGDHSDDNAQFVLVKISAELKMIKKKVKEEHFGNTSPFFQYKHQCLQLTLHMNQVLQKEIQHLILPLTVLSIKIRISASLNIPNSIATMSVWSSHHYQWKRCTENISEGIWRKN